MKKGNIGGNMRTKIARGISVGSVCIVIILTCFLIIPGYTLAGTTSDTTPGEPHKPAYLQSKEQLEPVTVVFKESTFQPIPPRSANLDIVDLIEQLDESLILGYLENLTSFGPRLSGTDACDQAGRYLFDTFEDMGLAVRFHNYTDSTVSGSNIEATLPGSNSTNIFIICAHYDSVASSPGADDDGSGVAAVLAAANIMRNYEFHHTVRFVCFSGEEQGLIGSRHYAEDAYTNNDSIIAVLNADMIGFATSSYDGRTGKIFENDASEWIVEYTQYISQLYTEYINIELIPQGETWGSDHYYFWQYGYDAVFYHEFNFNDYYHSPDDTIEHMNMSYCARFSRLILATLAEMALNPRPVLEIRSITGGYGVTTRVVNAGDVNAENVIGEIKITGGLFRQLNLLASSQTEELTPDDILEVKARLFRIGKIDIAVSAFASNADQVTRHASGLLLGPLVLKVVYLP